MAIRTPRGARIVTNVMTAPLAVKRPRKRTTGNGRRNGIVSAGAFAFIFSWTEFLFAQVLTRTDTVTLPVALAGIVTGFQGNQYGEASALTMVSLIPALALAILIQKHLVRGLTLGAVTG